PDIHNAGAGLHRRSSGNVGIVVSKLQHGGHRVLPTNTAPTDSDLSSGGRRRDWRTEHPQPGAPSAPAGSAEHHEPGPAAPPSAPHRAPPAAPARAYGARRHHPQIVWLRPKYSWSLL